MNETPPFPISPLDDGKPPSRVPVASARVEIEGENWLLRPCNGLLFARRESQSGGDWTFAASKPLADDDVSAERLGELWGEALANQKIARFVLFYTQHTGRELPLFFAEGGVGWMREFWNRDDFAFKWRTYDVQWNVLTRPIEEFQAACGQIFDKYLRSPLANWNEDHPDEPAYCDEPLHFLCGSQGELERLCRLICLSDGLISLSQTPIKVEIDSENGFERAGLERLNFENFEFVHTHISYKKVMKGEPEWEGEPPSSHLLRLFQLAIEENTPVGVNWEYCYELSGRASHTPESETAEFSFPPPSMHEHLEARIQLREWLSSRVSSEELAELLS